MSLSSFLRLLCCQWCQHRLWSDVASCKIFSLYNNKCEHIDIDRLLLFLVLHLVFPSTEKIKHHNNIDIDSSCVWDVTKHWSFLKRNFCLRFLLLRNNQLDNREIEKDNCGMGTTISSEHNFISSSPHAL